MYTLKGRPGVILRAKRDAVRRLPEIWRARRTQHALLGPTNKSNIDRVKGSMARGLLTPYLYRHR